MMAEITSPGMRSLLRPMVEDTRMLSTCNIMHADGAGTKSSLAYMYWKETGDLGVWKGIAQLCTSSLDALTPRIMYR